MESVILLLFTITKLFSKFHFHIQLGFRSEQIPKDNSFIKVNNREIFWQWLYLSLLC